VNPLPPPPPGQNLKCWACKVPSSFLPWCRLAGSCNYFCPGGFLCITVAGALPKNVYAVPLGIDMSILCVVLSTMLLLMPAHLTQHENTMNTAPTQPQLLHLRGA
jgi:hypothetical protein